MSPEIIQKKSHNYFKADIWALGIVLYALLSGKFPFKGESNSELYQRIKTGNYSMPDCISMEAKAMLLKMLAKHPDKRYSCDRLLNDIWFGESPSKIYLISEIDPKQKNLNVAKLTVQ
jgi:serine/threonine protein kinase